MRFRLLIILTFLSLTCCKSEKATQLDHFNAPLRQTEPGLLSSAFSVERKKKEQRSEIPGGFRRPISKKQSKGKRVTNTANDHFSGTYETRERSKEDLIVKTYRKRYQRPQFIGERFRIFSRDPNRKKKKKQQKHTNNTFSRKAKKVDRAQSPKGQKGLFQNGVLPKMKDMN